MLTLHVEAKGAHLSPEPPAMLEGTEAVVPLATHTFIEDVESVSESEAKESLGLAVIGAE